MAETTTETATSPTTPTEKKGMSTGAKIAIGCGALLVIGAIIFGILLIVGGNAAKKGLEDLEKELEQEVKVESTYNVGESVDVNGIVWTVTEAEDLGSTLPAESEWSDDCVTDGKYILVRADVKNDSNEEGSILPLKLYDSEMREYSVTYDLYSCHEDDLDMGGSVNPGITKELVGFYEVPADSTDLKIKVTDLKFITPKEAYISLGL